MDDLYFYLYMEERLARIENKLDIILNKLETNVEANCEKMVDHITFVETLYERVKNPVGFLCHKINYYIGNEQYSLE